LILEYPGARESGPDTSPLISRLSLIFSTSDLATKAYCADAHTAMRLASHLILLFAVFLCVDARPRSGAVARHAQLSRRHAVSHAARTAEQDFVPEPVVLVIPRKRRANAISCGSKSTLSRRAQRNSMLAELQSLPSRTYRRSQTCSANSTSSGNPSSSGNSSSLPLTSQPSSAQSTTPFFLLNVAGSALASYGLHLIS